MAHLDLKLMSPQKPWLSAQYTFRKVLPLSLLHALLSWVRNRAWYSEKIAEGGKLSFMGKKIYPFGMSEWVSSCNNPMLSP